MMTKKFLLLAMFVLGVNGIYADDFAYPYLVFTNTDGSQTVVASESLELTIVDGQLVAKNGTATTSLTLANLAAMQFSTTKDGIADEIVTLADAESITHSQPTAIYDLSGRRAYQPMGKAMRRGVYVVRNANGKTSKIAVK
ncbi:MAG: hypothetical protein IJK15_05430 [Bacteroidaceae bacterium]|nr:hypothetical protein [Bacteroidaceae bacterium]